MKRINLLSVIAMSLIMLTMASCDNKKFHIEGNITDAKDSILYLENVGLNGPEVIDSVKLSADGAFSFKGKGVEAPEFYRLRIASGIISLSIDSTETVTVNASYPTMSYNYDVKGSEECETIKTLSLKQIKLQNDIYAAIRSNGMSAYQIEDSIVRLVEAYKQDVKMNYIFKQPMKASSYFALFQTVAVGGNYTLIFNPRSNEEDIKVFAAVATSWDTFHPGALRGENLHNIAIEGLKTVRIVKNRQNAVIDASKIDTSGALDIQLTDNHGATRKLSDLKGKVVMLDFHAFAMENSMQRIMLMRELYNKYHDRGFEIYQVSFDADEHFWKTKTAALPWVSVFDPAGANSDLAVRFNLMQLPTYYLVGRDNLIYKRDIQIADIDKEIQALL